MNVINKLLESKLFSNIFNQIILYGFSHLIPFFLMPFLVDRIGIELYGIIYFAIAFTTYFQVINEFGFDLSNVRHIVNNKNDIGKLSRIFSAIIQSKLCLYACTFVIYLIVISLIPKFKDFLLLYILSFIRIFGVIFSPYWFFRTMEDVKYVTRLSVIVKIICILPIFILVQTPTDAIWVMVCFALETNIGGLVGIFVAAKKYKLKLCLVSFKEIKFYLKDSWPFFTSTFITRIYQNSNVVILGFYCSEVITGIYTASEKLFRAYNAFISPLISYIFYPYFQRVQNFSKINRLVGVIIGLNILFIITLFFFSDYIIPIFLTNAANEIVQYFKYFLILIAISVPNDILGFPYLGVMGYIKQVNYTTLISGAIYLSLSIIAIVLDMVSPLNMILILTIVNFVSILYRIFYIRIYQYK